MSRPLWLHASVMLLAAGCTTARGGGPDGLTTAPPAMALSHVSFGACSINGDPCDARVREELTFGLSENKAGEDLAERGALLLTMVMEVHNEPAWSVDFARTGGTLVGGTLIAPYLRGKLGVLVLGTAAAAVATGATLYATMPVLVPK